MRILVPLESISGTNTPWNTGWISAIVLRQPPNKAVFNFRPADITSAVIWNGDNREGGGTLGATNLTPWLTQVVALHTWPSRVNDICPPHRISVERIIFIFGGDHDRVQPIEWTSRKFHHISIDIVSAFNTAPLYHYIYKQINKDQSVDSDSSTCLYVCELIW